MCRLQRPHPKDNEGALSPEHVYELLLSPLYSLKATVSSKTWDLRSQGLKLIEGTRYPTSTTVDQNRVLFLDEGIWLPHYPSLNTLGYELKDPNYGDEDLV